MHRVEVEVWCTTAGPQGQVPSFFSQLWPFGKVHFMDCEDFFSTTICGHYYDANTDHDNDWMRFKWSNECGNKKLKFKQ